MKVLLISPAPDTGLSEMREPHHGLAYIAAYLQSKGGFEISVIDAKTRHQNTSQVIEQASQIEADVVGITAMTPDILWARKIAEGIKRQRPSLPIILGGQHVTILTNEVMEKWQCFDIAVLGEGEITMHELLEGFFKGNTPLNQINGIAFRDNGRVIITPPRGTLDQLDILPFPAWEYFPPVTSEKRTYPVYGTRGCPYRCKFCCAQTLGNKVRKRSPLNIIQEIERNIEQYGSRRFSFCDETFGVDRRWTYELLDTMVQRGLPEKIDWGCMTRVNLVDEELFSRMKKAGCFRVAFGIESGNQRILDAVAKGIRLDQVTKAVKVAKDLGFQTVSYFIIGHPYETYSTAQDTIDFATKLNTTDVTFSKMVPLPGTEVYEMAKRGEGNYTYVSDNWDEYRKHYAHPLGLRDISPEGLDRLVIKAYLTFYLYNHRWRDLFNLLWARRAGVIRYCKAIIKYFLQKLNFITGPETLAVKTEAKRS